MRVLIDKEEYSILVVTETETWQINWDDVVLFVSGAVVGSALYLVIARL